MKPNNDQIREFIEKCIKERREWASSPEGYRSLGSGSPTIPGLQEYHLILQYVNTGNPDPLAGR